MSWTITPIHLGTLTVHKALEVRLTGFNELIDVPMISWYLTDGLRKIIVDTGPCSTTRAARYHRAMKQSADQTFEVAFQRLSLDPKSVDTIILTHLHWDHCMGNDLFPNARVYIQEAEIEYAKKPFPCDARSYEADLGGFICASSNKRIASIQGDYDLAPGLSLTLTPGHSPGSQSVIVNGAHEKYILVGDAISFLESWEATPKKLPGIYTSLADCYATYKKLDSIGGTILPGHEASVIGKTFS